MRQLFLFVALAVIGAGLYLVFFYDVPDAQETLNFFMGRFFLIVGVAGLFVNLLWSAPKSKSRNLDI